MEKPELNNIRYYGSGPFTVAVIHGGPGAAGEMAPVARELSLVCGILEPLQTATSIEGQLQELQEVLKKHGNLPATLIGHSWGAWLSYIFAARYPTFVKKLILVASGPFEEKYASQIMERRLKRLSEPEQSQVHFLMEALNKPNVENKNILLAQFGDLMSKTDSFDPLPLHEEEAVDCRGDVYQNVWEEAQALRQSGALLKLGEQIQCPVIAIHGDYDPHPLEGVKEPLSLVIKDFRFILLKNCGHSPWLEMAAREDFYRILKEEACF